MEGIALDLEPMDRELAGLITDVQRRQMFGPKLTLSQIGSKTAYRYFSTSLMNMHHTILSPYMQGLYMNQYKTRAESDFSSSTNAYIHSGNGLSEIFISAEKGNAYISAKLIGNKFEIGSSYLPKGGPSTRMNSPSNLGYKLWKLV